MAVRATPIALFCLASFVVAPASAQRALDRTNPDQGRRDEAARKVIPAKKPAVPIEVDAPSGSSASDGSVLVGAVTLAGLQALSPADFADILAKRVGQTLRPADLSTLASDIAARARARGYVFASAWIEPQRIANGILMVSVDEGRIDEIRFDGPVQPAVRSVLEPLVGAGPARLDDVERRLLIAGDIDGVHIRSSRFMREKGKGVLLVRVTQDRITARVQLSDEGTRPLGPEQVQIDVDFNALLASDDALMVTYSGTPAQPGEMQFGRVRYAKRISASGTEVAVVGSVSATHPGSYLEPLDLRSRSWFAGMEVLQPLLRRRRASMWLEGELGVRDLTQWRGGVGVRHDRVSAARLTLYGYSDFAGGRLRVSSTLSQGFGILGATEPGDPLASRGDADGVFTALSAWSEWTRQLAGPLSVRLSVESQIASEPLLIGEEMGLGGTAFLRGYDWSERSGDQGAAGSIELRYMIDHPFGLIPRAQLYGFFDGGTVSNLHGGYGGGSLASAGGGVRADLSDHMGANVEVAVPLTGPRYDTGDESAKFNFRLVHSF
jgi:hemolysin activation/secretion protein